MRACTSAYAFFAESVVCISTGVVSIMHVQVCTLDRCCEHQRTQLPTRSLQNVYMRSCICSLLHWALGNEDGGVQLVYESTRCLAWGIIFDWRKDRGVVCVFLIFNAGRSVCWCMYVYMHTHIHCTGGVIGCEPRSRDEKRGGPEESRWTKSWHTYHDIRICVRSTHAYVYARRRDEILG